MAQSIGGIVSGGLGRTPPIDDSEGFDPPHEWVNYIPDADDEDDDTKNRE